MQARQENFIHQFVRESSKITKRWTNVAMVLLALSPVACAQPRPVTNTTNQADKACISNWGKIAELKQSGNIMYVGIGDNGSCNVTVLVDDRTNDDSGDDSYSIATAQNGNLHITEHTVTDSN